MILKLRANLMRRWSAAIADQQLTAKAGDAILARLKALHPDAS
jgi:hypothetical protein